MRVLLAVWAVLLLSTVGISAAETESAFSSEELSVAAFWEAMGPTLRDEGIEAYARRYHEDFRHWDIDNSGRMATKESAIRAWSKFHEDGHRITCTHVEPITIDIVGDLAFARLLYEQTDTYADGRTSTGLWRMVDVFKRHGDTWQVLESNMVDITPEEKETDEDAYRFHCPRA